MAFLSHFHWKCVYCDQEGEDELQLGAMKRGCTGTLGPRDWQGLGQLVEIDVLGACWTCSQIASLVNFVISSCFPRMFCFSNSTQK